MDFVRGSSANASSQRTSSAEHRAGPQTITGKFNSCSCSATFGDPCRCMSFSLTCPSHACRNRPALKLWRRRRRRRRRWQVFAVFFCCVFDVFAAAVASVVKKKVSLSRGGERKFRKEVVDRRFSFRLELLFKHSQSHQGESSAVRARAAHCPAQKLARRRPGGQVERKLVVGQCQRPLMSDTPQQQTSARHL